MFFRVKYGFLSNMHTCKIEYNGYTYSSVEAAYQAQMFNGEYFKKMFSTLSGQDAKHRSNELRQYRRKDFYKMTDQIMYDLVYIKFTTNDILKEKLLNTGDVYLIEDNFWHDNYWGRCDCGSCAADGCENKLGKILMHIRSILKEETLGRA